MVHVQVALVVFVDVNLQIRVVVFSSRCNDDRVGFANGVVLLFFFGVAEGVRVSSLQFVLFWHVVVIVVVYFELFAFFFSF